MSIKAFPLNQTEYSYNAQDVMKYYAGRNSGVFETGENLKVSANGGLEIRVNSGMGWLSRDYVASVAFWNESVDYLMVDAGHDTYDRIDLVVVSWNFVQQEQNPKLIIRKGTPASSPAVPSLVNNSSTIEIALARINVGKGAITLSDSNIVDLRGNDTYCPMVYDEQTIREAFRKCVGYADGVNKISDFPSVTPASSDKILIEQGGAGKSATLESLPIPTSVQRELNTKVNYTDSLTYEEIMASTDLTNKVSSAEALKTLRTLVEFYNIPRVTPKDITPYWTDGTLWNRIAGSSGFKPYEDIHVGDYIDMGRTVTCPDSYDSAVGSQYVTVASCGGFYGNGDSGITYPHLIMVPGKGFGGVQHFGRHAMHASNPHPGYVSSDMNQSVLGPVVTEGSIATGATINQQLYYIFGSHLKTIKSLLATAMSSSLYNRFGSAEGASSGCGWQSVQTRLMSEIEVYGSIVWSSSGYDTGDANHQFELFRFSKSAVNNRSAYYWLKDAASSSRFCICSNDGISDYYAAINSNFFVRPCFILA